MQYLKFIPVAILALVYACNSSSSEKKPLSETDSNQYDLALKEYIALFDVLPSNAPNPDNEISTEKVELGQLLYFDKRLSKDGTISCNSCHDLKAFGVDNLPTSPGVGGVLGARNSPTVFNAALHSTQFWDGRAKDVEEQAGMPILNPVEMAIPDEDFLIERLSKIPLYQERFKTAFPEDETPLNYENLKNAIGAFERKLLTPSPFDDYLAGDVDALSLKQKKGMISFSKVGCTTCHAGKLLGGELLQKFGLFHDYWKFTNNTIIDEGLFELTQNEADKYIFKVPSLRNIAHTGPYFHDGSVESLAEAVRIMAKVQLDRDLSDSETENIVAFLEALTGDIPDKYKEAPKELEASL